MEKSGFSDFEKEAMKERAAELRKEQANKRSKKNPEADVLERIAAMDDQDSFLASKLHTLVRAVAPELGMKTWYGMPAYTNAAGKVVLHFSDAGKFKTRYSTVNFSDAAQLDQGAMWPIGFALTEWTPAIEAQLKTLILKALG